MSTEEAMSTETAEEVEPGRNKGQFRKGETGNPKGRPRRSNATLSEAVRKAQNTKVTVTEGGRRRRMTKNELTATQLVNKSAGGDLSAIRLVSRIEAEAPDDAHQVPVTLSETDREIAARLVERIRALTQGAG